MTNGHLKLRTNFHHLDGRDRATWVGNVRGFDSFGGLPKPTWVVDPALWTEGMYTAIAPYHQVYARLMVDKRPWLKLVKGWFNDTLIEAPASSIEKIAYARIDKRSLRIVCFLDGRLVDGGGGLKDDWQFSFDIGSPAP